MTWSRLINKSRSKSKHFHDYVFKYMKTLSYTISSFTLSHSCLAVFLFCLHFCLLSHFEIIRCVVKSLIANFNIFFVEIQLKNKTWKVFCGCQGLGAQIGILVSQMAWIHTWFMQRVPRFKFFLLISKPS